MFVGNVRNCGERMNDLERFPFCCFGEFTLEYELVEANPNLPVYEYPRWADYFRKSFDGREKNRKESFVGFCPTEEERKSHLIESFRKLTSPLSLHENMNDIFGWGYERYC